MLALSFDLAVGLVLGNGAYLFSRPLLGIYQSDSWTIAFGAERIFYFLLGVSDVSLEIGDGEFLCILGPSGCGKTTLLRLVGGFENPSGGSILLNGSLYSSPEHSLPVERRNLGMVFQSFALWPNMTVRQHAAFPLLRKKFASMGAAEKKRLVDRTLDGVGLLPLSDR